MTWRLRHLLCRGTALCEGAKAAFEDADLFALILAQQLAVRGNCRLFRLWIGGAEGPGVAAFRVIRAADERAAGPGCAHRQTARAAVGAKAWIGAIAGIGEKVRFQHLVDFVQHFADAQIGGFSNRCRKVAPEPFEQLFIVAFSGAYLVELIF